MKKLLFVFAIIFSVTQLWSEKSVESSGPEKSKEDRNFRIPLIGESAPSFTAESTNGTINFPSDYGRKWKILFSHPLDFTPVCSTEILELGYLQEDFDKFGVKIVVISVNPLEEHVQWKKALELVKQKNREPLKIKFPLVEDKNIVISKMYGMIHSKSNSSISVRGVFIIDADNIIQAIYFYPMNIGRNTDELLRVITALQKSAKENVMTPVNWKIGDDVLIKGLPKISGNDSSTLSKNFYSPAWFILYKKSNPE